jgi:hypothetical protein
MASIAFSDVVDEPTNPKDGAGSHNVVADAYAICSLESGSLFYLVAVSFNP